MTLARPIHETRAYPPFRMKAGEAAYYCGMSVSAFRGAVAAGDLPQGRKVAGGRYWLRTDLEAAMMGETPSESHDFSAPI